MYIHLSIINMLLCFQAVRCRRTGTDLCRWGTWGLEKEQTGEPGLKSQRSGKRSYTFHRWAMLPLGHSEPTCHPHSVTLQDRHSYSHFTDPCWGHSFTISKMGKKRTCSFRVSLCHSWEDTCQHFRRFSQTKGHEGGTSPCQVVQGLSTCWLCWSLTGQCSGDIWRHVMVRGAPREDQRTGGGGHCIIVRICVLFSNRHNHHEWKQTMLNPTQPYC